MIEQFTKTRQVLPLIHCITNLVTINDVANRVIACVASPIMAMDPLKGW